MRRDGKSAINESLKGVKRDIYGERYYDHILEIYKIYVKMADNISDRRQKANSFFITINSAIMGIMGYLIKIEINYIMLIITSLVGIILAILWASLINSFKQINKGKFKVIHEIESYLPIKPYTLEWEILKRGEDPKIYRPFTKIENLIPWVFFFLYTCISIIILLLKFYDFKA